MDSETFNRPVGYESRKAYRRRCESGFWDRFIAGPKVLDIGFRGGINDALPIVEGAIGVELGYPGYDGETLPFDTESIDTVHASHVLEHVPFDNLKDWFRVIRIGGTLIIMVPHAYLYERRISVPPSRWSPEHLRAYTPTLLLMHLELRLTPNTYRIEHMADVDDGYDYDLPITSHPVGCLEIELVLRKRTEPAWRVEP